MDVKRDGMFWIVGKNKWNSSTYSKKDAAYYALTLVDCISCIDCKYCVSCNTCVNCAHCINCSDIVNSHYCIECEHSKDLIECHRCMYADDCTHQSNLAYISDLYRQPSFSQRFEYSIAVTWEVRYYDATSDDEAELYIVSSDGDVFERFEEFYKAEYVPEDVKAKVRVIEEYIKTFNK